MKQSAVRGRKEVGTLLFYKASGCDCPGFSRAMWTRVPNRRSSAYRLPIVLLSVQHQQLYFPRTHWCLLCARPVNISPDTPGCADYPARSFRYHIHHGCNGERRVEWLNFHKLLPEESPAGGELDTVPLAVEPATKPSAEPAAAGHVTERHRPGGRCRPLPIPRVGRFLDAQAGSMARGTEDGVRLSLPSSVPLMYSCHCRPGCPQLCTRCLPNPRFGGIHMSKCDRGNPIYILDDTKALKEERCGRIQCGKCGAPFTHRAGELVPRGGRSTGPQGKEAVAADMPPAGAGGRKRIVKTEEGAAGRTDGQTGNANREQVSVKREREPIGAADPGNRGGRRNEARGRGTGSGRGSRKSVGEP